MGIDGEVPLRQASIVTHRLELGDLQQIGPSLAAQILRQVRCRNRFKRCLSAGATPGA